MGNRDAAKWARALDLLRYLDPEWAEAYSNVVVNPFLSGALSAKDYQLIAVGLSAAVTHLNETALRRHIGSALRAGASQTEILEVLKMAALLALHPMALGAPILLEEAEAAGVPFAPRPDTGTPSCDTMRSIGQWNAAWDAFYQLDRGWAEAFVASGAGLYTSDVLTPKFVELIGIAFDAAVTHLYAAGTRCHIRAALALGASPEEIMTVLEMCVSQGADALHLGVPILAEEFEIFAGHAAGAQNT
jgi:alkylhydroperoxidase/carboxymuconolactone decarboxylase family protein YurZ